MKELLRLFRMYLLPNVIFYALFRSSNAEHHRMTLIKDGRTTNQDFINWAASKQDEIGECILIDFRIVK